MSKKHVCYVYGTLRPGTNEIFEAPGRMYSLGGFPGVKLDETNSTFKCERVEVSDKVLDRLDRYEGYNPQSPDTSLFVRVPFRDGEIYQYNGAVDMCGTVPHGDWLKFVNREQGGAHRFLEE